MNAPAPNNLSTAQAVAYLATIGVATSRSTLDHLRQTGKLAWVKARRRAYAKTQPTVIGIDYARAGDEQSAMVVVHNGN